MTRYLYLVRHGQMDRSRPPTDKLHNGLSPLGRRQAERTARRLAHLPITVIQHSTLRRAAETADIIASHFPDVPVRPTKLLWETVPSYPASQSKLFTDVPPALIKRSNLQVAQAFARYFKPSKSDRHELIVSHGNTIAYFVARVVGAAPDQWTHFDTRNCGITEVTIDVEGWMQLVAFGDTRHLPESMRTF